MKKMKNMIVSTLPILLLLGLMNHCTHSTEPKHTGPDTTSQNFTFQTWEFGDGLTSSYFHDAWIFDENNIWVVGYVQQDSFPGNCNIMRWNGQKWSYVKRGDGYGNSSGLTSIWAVDSSEIYFSPGHLRFKNGIWERLPVEGTFSNGQLITKLWGSGSNNIWGVGSGGAVVHYDGVSWKKVDVGGAIGKDLSKVYFQYITGINSNHFWVNGYDILNDTESILIENKNGQWKVVFYTSGNSYRPIDASIYNLKLNDYWLMGRTISKIVGSTNETIFQYSYIGWLSSANYTNNPFEIVVVGYWGEMIHWNGKKFKQYTNDINSGDTFFGTRIKDKTWISVGINNHKAIIKLGKR